MGRRRKVATTSKPLISKAKVTKKSPRKAVVKKLSVYEEQSQSEDDSSLLPSSSSQDTCLEETVIEPLQNEVTQTTSAGIVHKKFGKVQCLVEADSAGLIEPEELVVGEDTDTILTGVTELIWDDDEVVEETVICEGMELEDTGSQEGNQVDLHEEPDSQCSDFDQEPHASTLSVSVTEYQSLELDEAPLITHLVTSHEEVFISEDIEFSNSPGKDTELDQLSSDKVYYCESESTSKDDDSQGSENLTTTAAVATEIFATEIGVSKLKIGDVAFLNDNVTRPTTHETVVCQMSMPENQPLVVDVDGDDTKCSPGIEIETKAQEENIGETETNVQLTLSKDIMCTRSRKKTTKSQIIATTSQDLSMENEKSPIATSLDISAIIESRPIDLNDARSILLEMPIKDIADHHLDEESVVHSGDSGVNQGSEVCNNDLIVEPVLLKNDEQQKENKEAQENCAIVEEVVQVSDSHLRKTDEDEVENKQVTPTFRSRSGSTDTTGSESSSNCSSVVRRSSRIRSISVLKQRSRSRCELVSTSSDVKVAESRDSSDGNSGTETQSDKEGMSIKVPTPMSTHGSVSSSGSSKHLDFKPVKVKSRWRRSSELEMGGNRSSDSDVAVTPPTPICVSPHLVVSRSSTMSPQFGVVSTPLLPAASQASEALLEVLKEEYEERREPKKETPCEFEQVVLEDAEMEERLRQFVHLKENDYLTERTICKEAKRMVCDCFLTKEEIIRGELGCGEDCLNRLLMIECGSRCTLGERCTNKHFQKQEYSTCEVFRTEKKGFGLRAIEDLSSGSFIMEYVGEVLNPKEFRKRAKDYAKDKNRHYYFMALKSDSIIDATMKGNISRFINHSCDPNSETQKWTVNGELRIGFFTSKNVAAGEEVTFDYQFQRYGKEAQRCFCESPFCRGWIGDDPEKENEKPERKGRKDREVKKKRAEKKQVEEEFLDDIDLEEEMEKLCNTGLKNRVHTVTLCRLMVRGRDTQTRVQLLQLVQRGEPACRRLFLDYHGLKLIASWMPDAGADNTDQLQTEILKTLTILPIPNKTVLQDSKVLSFVEKWSVPPVDESATAISSSSIPCTKLNLIKSDVDEDGESKMQMDEETPASSTVEPDQSATTDGNEAAVMKDDVKEETHVKDPINLDLALALLTEWSSLKEVFRIPKKERIEQMKEHEREADRGYKEYLDKETTPDKQSYDRWPQRTTSERERKKIKESPEPDKIRKSRFDDRGPKLSKQERRQLFALKVAKEEEEERQRQQHEDLWRSHEEQCGQIGLDPYNTLAFDPETNQRCLFDPNTRSWLPFDCSASEEELHSSGFNPNNPSIDPYDPNNPNNAPYDPNDLPNSHYDTGNHVGGPYNPNHYDPNNPMGGHYDPNSPVGSHYDPSGLAGVMYDSNNALLSQYNANYVMNSPFDPNVHVSHPHNPHGLKQELPYGCTNPPLPPDHPPLPPDSSNPPLPLGSGNPPLPLGSFIPPLPPDCNTQMSAKLEADDDEEEVFFPMELLQLPSKWRSVQDGHGRTYFYHVVVRIPQWHPPWEDCEDQTSESSDESSEDETAEEDEGSTSEEDEEEDEDDLHVKQEVEADGEEDDVEEVVDQEATLPTDETDVTLNAEPSKIDQEPLERVEKIPGLCEESETVENNDARPDESIPMEESDEKEDAVPEESGEITQEHGEPTDSPDGIDIAADQSEPMDLEEDEEEEEEEPQFVEVEVTKKRREGLVQERIISPRREEDRPEKKNYREIKEKLRRKKEQARKARAKKKRRDAKEKERSNRKAEKFDGPSAADNSSDAARKIKDHFRLQMAGAMVQYLNPYRKTDCKQGRINNTEDFKHLARKLTHFVMVKELKHCRSVDDLDCNDNVKHKARDFIKKYMSKFGPIYQRPDDE